MQLTALMGLCKGITEWRRFAKVQTKTAEHSRATVAALKDPQGARRALWEYGKLCGFPDLILTRLILRGGEKGWIQALTDSEPLWLGIAWDIIEGYELMEDKKRQVATASSQAQTTNDKAKGQTDVAVLQWTESNGVAAGDYSAVITEIIDEDGNFGPQVRLQFVVLDSDGDQTEDQIRGWCSQKWGPKTKLFEWARAVLGKKCPAPGQPFDTDKLKNKKCDIRVEEKPGPNGPRSSIVGVYPFGTINRVDAEDDDADKPPF